MNDILFGNNNHKVLWRIAKRNLTENRRRNILLIVAIFMTTFMCSTVFHICANGVEKQRIYSLQYLHLTNQNTEPIIYILAIIAVLVLITGFLFIYNVMSISVVCDIRFYGLLRSIGMSAKQLYRMVQLQVLLLCGVGIPAGLIASVALSALAVPMFFRMYPEYLEAGYSMRLYPLIFVVSGLLALVTALIGGGRPAKKAIHVSAVDAVRYTEIGYYRKRIHSSEFSARKLALRNVFRVPKQAVLVFCSLFLGMTLFMAVAVILNSTSVDMYAESTNVNVRGDIELTNVKAGDYIFDTGRGMEAFDIELMSDIEDLAGITNIEISYFNVINMEVVDEEGMVHVYPGYVYGVASDYWEELKKEKSEVLNESSLEAGEAVLIRNIWKYPEFPQTMDTNMEDGNRTGTMDAADSSGMVKLWFDDSEQEVFLSIGGILPAEYDTYYGTMYNRIPCIYMSEQMLKAYVKEPAIYEVILTVESENEKEVLHRVQELMEKRDEINILSPIETREGAEQILYILTVLGDSMALTLCVIGIMNFINVIMTSILSRHHEIALLESVGQSAKQSQRILVWEGIIYATISLGLVSVLGSAVIGVIYRFMKQEFAYMRFMFPVMEVVLMVVIIYGICLSVPLITYRRIVGKSIAERLRETG